MNLLSSCLLSCVRVLAAAGFLVASCAAQDGDEHHLKFDLDPLIALPGVWELTQETIDQKSRAEGFETSPFFHWSGRTEGAKDRAVFGRKPYNNVTVAATLFGGKVPVEEAIFEFKGGKVASVQVTIGAAEGAAALSAEAWSQHKAACEAALNTLLATPSSPSQRLFGFKSTKAAKTLTWKGAGAVAALDFSAGPRLLGFTLGPAGTDLAALLTKPVRGAGNDEELFVNLDALLALPALWALTPEKIEAGFAAGGFEESPFYQWLTTEKSGVRFSRRPYSNVTVDLSLFNGSVPVDEAVIEFAEGKASRISVSIYNRGDGGTITAQDFAQRYKATGVELGRLLGTRPTERRPDAKSAVKISGWVWTSPAALASLEMNADALTAQPEFLRLKLAAPGARDAFASESGQSIVRSALGRSALPKFVKRESNGDTYVGSVPMVDQGDKGYCVVASCQRLFGYLRIPCDQHEIAQIAGSDAGRGTSIMGMEEALHKIDSRFKVNFKSVAYRLNDGGMGVPYGNRMTEVNEAKFTKLVQDYAAKGIPLLWVLELGRYPEEPPNAAQSGGVHMRLIIGANPGRGELLFTDSWGAGHELKRMKMGDAYRASMAVYAIEPKEY